MLFELFLNGLGNNLHHTEPVECTEYLKPVVRVFQNPTSNRLFHGRIFPFMPIYKAESL